MELYNIKTFILSNIVLLHNVHSEFLVILFISIGLSKLEVIGEFNLSNHCVLHCIYLIMAVNLTSRILGLFTWFPVATLAKSIHL